MQVPIAVNVTAAPFIVQTVAAEGSTDRVTVRFDEAVAIGV